MELGPQIYTGKVMHKRLFPKVNGFTYGIYYIALPLSRLKDIPIALNRFGLMSFYEKDHGSRGVESPEGWARGVLKTYGVAAEGEIVLISMPRILGYVFNPVSFWLCFDLSKTLRAVICEVNNTFGETHSYLCRHADGRAIVAEDTLFAEKLFHVSPFLEREGHYTFRFNLKDDKFGVWIDFYDAQGNKKLLTSLLGNFQPMTKAACSRVFWAYPLVTFKAISLIHWQAIKLISKGIRHIKKPLQKPERLSATTEANLTQI